MPDLSPERSTEGGFTLVELLVYCALFVMILVLVGGLLLNALKGEGLVTDSSEATQSGQVAAQSLKGGIESATDLKLTAPSPGHELLIARRYDSGAEGFKAVCEAWYFTPVNGGSLYWKRVSPAAKVIDPVASGNLGGWKLLVDGLKPTGAKIFSNAGDRVTIDFTAASGNRPPVEISTIIHQRNVQSGDFTCF